MNSKQEEASRNVYRIITNMVLTVAVTLLFALLWYLKLNNAMDLRFLTIGNYLMIGVYMVIAILVINTFNGYKITIQRISINCLSQGVALVITNCIMIVVSVLMIRNKTLILYIVLLYAVLTLEQSLAVLVITYSFTKLYRYFFPPYKTLHVSGEYENTLVDKMNLRDDMYSITGEVSCREDIEKITAMLDDYDAVLINDVPSETRNKILKVCFDAEKRVYFTPKISDIIVKGAEEVNIFDTPLYLCKNVGLSPFQSAIKRLGDILISLVGIILTSPIMLVTAIAIHSYDKGPVFYKQVRCTKNGKEYKIMKFRSMITNAEADGKARLASENDDRITPVGHFIRATRIDELPQFFNILKGDMSIVGPRPERPEIIKEYVEAVPEFAYRTRVKAGLTGYAQVYGKYNTTSYDKLKLDMIYVEKCSVLLDIQLILMTLRVILTKDSTEGLEQGATTANVKKE